MTGLHRVLLALALLPALAQGQSIQTYTHTQTGIGLRPLGFPVPQPIASLTPVDGFRDYASLHARLQSLALMSDDVVAHSVGQTHAGRAIWAYAVGSASETDREGRAKSAFFINATTHAREWGIPEISTGLVERMVDGANDGGLVRYLLDNSRLVIIPVQNVDGFLQTQRYPTQVVVGLDPRVPNDWPRDGRMRRKNMRGVDEVLTSFNDHLLGVDLNRNHSPFWGTVTNGGQLTNPNDLTFRGPAAQSEPEVQALLNAAALAPVSRLRLGIDAHSHSKVFFSSNTGRTRLNAIQSRLLSVLSAHHAAVPTANGAPNGKVYADVRDPPNTGIGVAAEYFAYQWLVPAWTLEIEPGNFGGQEYGGTAESHGGFVLPESQARRVREAWAESHLIAFYFMAGPPHLARVRVFDATSGNLLQEQRWEYRPQTLQREKFIEALAPLRAGQRVQVELAFSKPMRHRVGGQVVPLPGQGSTPPPQVWLTRDGQQSLIDTSGGEWQEAGWRYRDDSFRFETVLPTQPGEFGFDVSTIDMVGQQLDANPASPVDWSAGAWSGWNSSAAAASEGDLGGVDTTTRLQASMADAHPRPRLLSVLPQRAGEGDVLTLRFVLDTPASQRIEVLGERPDYTRLRALMSPPPPPPPKAIWNVGEVGERSLKIGLPDDALVQGDRPITLRVGVMIGPDLEEQLAHTLEVFDNDRPEVVAIQAASLDAGYNVFADPSGASVFFLGSVVMLTGAPVKDAIARRSDPAVSGRINNRMVSMTAAGETRVFGNGGRYRLLSGSRPDTWLRIPATAKVSFDHLDIVSDDALLPPAPGESPQPLIDVAGRLSLHRSDINVNEDGAFTAAIANDGEVVIERSALRGWQGSTLISGRGPTKISNSSVLGNRNLDRVIGGGAVEIDRSSLVGNASGDARFATLPGSGSLPEGSLLFGGSLLQSNRTMSGVTPEQPDCAGRLSSSGFSVHDGSGCIGSGEGDLVGLSVGLPAVIEPTTRWLAPLGAAVDRGGHCTGVDQRGAPRPQAGFDGGEVRCDAGAIERGLNPYRGIWQPTRSGHGVELQTSGNRLILAWYTYGDDGQPTAYQAVAPLTGPRWQAELQLSRRNPTSGAIIPPARVGTVGIDFSSDVEATLRWRFDSRGTEGSEAIRPAQFSAGIPEVAVTGLWYPPADSGYGATIGRLGASTVVGLYYYDASGALRWVLGAGGGESFNDLEMFSYTGFCPDCNAEQMPVQSQPAGRVLVHFLSPVRARVDTDLTYPGPAGGSWQRSHADFVPISDPVDNAPLNQ